MNYCIEKNGAFVKRVGNEQIDWDATHSCTASALTLDEKSLFGVVEFAEAGRPAFDPVTQSVSESTPILVTCKWTQQWLVSALDSPTIAANLANAKAAKLEQIKASRDQRKDGGVLVNGKWFHTDTGSRIQQLGLVLMGAAVPAVAWKTLDGTFTPMSQTLAGQIFQAVATLDMALFAAAETHRVAMESSATPATYDFSTGWPEHFPL